MSELALRELRAALQNCKSYDHREEKMFFHVENFY